MIYIPIGCQCTGAGVLKDYNIRTNSFPFDWILSNPESIYKILILLLIDNMNIKELVSLHFFKCEQKATFDVAEHYYFDNDGKALCNTKYNLIFPHDTNDSETINKYIRRFQRLKDTILHSTEELVFLYISQSSLNEGNFTINGRAIVLNTYFYIEKINELLNQVRPNLPFKILFYTSCVENYDIKDTKIILRPLNSQDIWFKLIPEILKTLLQS